MAYINIPSGDSPERIRLWEMVPAMGHAIGVFRDAMFDHRALSLREVEVARMRIALINDCDI